MLNINKIPKIELHCHLDGSVRPSTLFELAKSYNIETRTDNLEEFTKSTHVSKDCSSLKDYLDKFSLPIAVMQTSDALKRITKELIEDVSKNNVKYIEIRFAPFFHMEKGLSFNQVIESVLEGMHEGFKEFGVYSNLILSAMRHLPESKTLELIDLGLPYLGKGVVAVDLAGNEADFPPELHSHAFKKAKEYGYHITIHAGETGISENIVTAVQALGAERIGHGVAAQKSEFILDMLKSKNICIESCPKSNLDTLAVTSYDTHPIKYFMENDFNITVNTDNMTVSSINLDIEETNLVNYLNFTEANLFSLYKNSINSSFASDDIKKKLLLYL